MQFPFKNLHYRLNIRLWGAFPSRCVPLSSIRYAVIFGFPLWCCLRWSGTQKTTQVAAGSFTANVLPMSHDQGMVLIEEFAIGGQRPLDLGPHGFVGKVFLEYIQSGEYPACIGIDDENRSLEGIQKDIIGGLPADSMHAKKGAP